MHDLTAIVTAQDFEPLIGDAFVLSDGSGELELRLDSVKPSEHGTIRDIPVMLGGVELPPRASFSVLFKGPVEPGFLQGSFNISHATLGEMTLLLACIGADADARFYEAVFG